MGVLDAPLNPDSGLYVPRTSRSRSPETVGLPVLFVENFAAWPLGMWNDGVGGAYRDTDIMFGGRPTVRLDSQGQSTGATTDPGRTAATQGVVFKRRVHDGFTGQFGLEGWFRFTSTNLTSNTYLSMSVYNRDGASAFHGRVWLDPNGNNQPMHARILDGAASAAANGVNALTGTTAVYADVTTSVLQNGAGTHMFSVNAADGRLDRAGGWHFVRLVVDLNAKKYVSLKLDGQPTVDLSGYSLDQTTTSGFAGMHFSWELGSATTTRRYVNIAQVIGYGK